MYSQCVEEAKEIRYVDFDHTSKLEECAYNPWYVKENEFASRYTALLAEATAAKIKEEIRFKILAEKWKTNTMFYSSLTKIVSDPSYKEIIAMGQSALAPMLRDLETTNSHWFTALEQVTSANPVPPEHLGNTARMAKSWLAWGRERGLV